MARAESDGGPDLGSSDPGAKICAAVAESHEKLLRSVALMIASSNHGLRWPEAMDRAAEVLNQAVEQALRNVSRFDPTRSATAWIRGIAARLLLSERRSEARDRRCVPAAALGSEAWSAALEQLVTRTAESAVVRRLDLEQALARISPEERRAIQLRYYEGLDGKALADALGASSVGAARVRVCRALQSLRLQFDTAQEEAES